MSALAPSRLSPADVVRTGSLGLRVRRARAALSALGIAIGVASMVAVLGISDSSKADLLAQLDRLGTNLLRVAPGQSFLGEDAVLPESAGPMLRRASGVEQVAATETISGKTVRRSPFVDEAETGGISVAAADPSLLATVGATLAHGRFLDAATARYPAVVLGADAAATLGLDDAGSRVWIGDRWFSVIGILDPVTLAEGLDSAALIGFDAAASLFGADRNASTVYVRTDPDRVAQARDLLGGTANPEHPEEVNVSRPSDALEAKAAAKTAFTSLFLGLGAVALLVGGVGIANVMVISVLERRSEIGLRRALGATRRHVGVQFLAESLLLAACGGLAGTLLGAAVTLGYARSEGWTASLPAVALVGGVGVAAAVGALAGLYPALRAARLSPTEALRTS
ncbi:ABC transporter permease [Candidatus Solirubrobacter pratensis]|uniref:ABC transporter permease n=1 Tax=Candidatus Solirubrobacter pratensis TaxID=1298857 RepID=UPI000412C91A|nr:ABC transporter permease [Candidatus Solirubrobacter pratensis]